MSLKELPGDVFVVGQVMPAQLAMLAGQGVQSIINNRPDREAPGQPDADDVQAACEEAGLVYAFLPMAGMLTPDLLAANAERYAELPRPIVAFCASGTRSAALWAFAHAKTLGVDTVMEALSAADYSLPQLRLQLEAWIARS